MRTNPTPAELIEEIVRDQLAGEKVEAVRVEEGVDCDGDRTYEVTVIHAKKGLLNPRATVGLATHIRHALLERNDTAFPMTKFVHKSEADFKSEAA